MTKHKTQLLLLALTLTFSIASYAEAIAGRVVGVSDGDTLTVLDAGNMQFIIEIITSATVAGLLTAALVWLTKSVISERLKNAIKNEYDQKLETHKAELKSTSNIEIEKLKSQLGIIAAQGNFKFTKLHEKRADAISEIYALLA
ncbi:MAG: endonuclease YncB(thermonuclease family) [Methylophilaceae bacterium]|jgi:endonuclease YncB( thermonuclease family)